jgi:3-oxoacyl-[acyl-carrier-protein] synthase-3
MPNAKIIGIGKYLPEKIYDNAYLESVVDTSDEWIIRRTGIKERHVSEDNEYTTDISVKAANKAIENAGINAEEIDLIILATVSPDYYTPSCACVVQNKIGAVNAAAFDFNAACSSFVTGMVIADQFIKSGMYKTIMVICADVLTKVTDYQDRATCVLFGDAAGAVILQADEGCRGILASELGADGSGAELITSLAVKNDESEAEKRVAGRKETIWMAGQAVMKFAVKAMSEASDRVLEKAGLTYDDIKIVVPHQANYRIVESAVKRMGIGQDKVYLNVHKNGNTSSSCIPVALAELEEEGRLERGDKILIVGFGGGLTWGAAIFEY